MLIEVVAISCFSYWFFEWLIESTLNAVTFRRRFKSYLNMFQKGTFQDPWRSILEANLLERLWLIQLLECKSIYFKTFHSSISLNEIFILLYEPHWQKTFYIDNLLDNCNCNFNYELQEYVWNYKGGFISFQGSGCSCFYMLHM